MKSNLLIKLIIFSTIFYITNGQEDEASTDAATTDAASTDAVSTDAVSTNAASTNAGSNGADTTSSTPFSDLNVNIFGFILSHSIPILVSFGLISIACLVTSIGLVYYMVSRSKRSNANDVLYFV
jgi:hypothetical protein